MIQLYIKDLSKGLRFEVLSVLSNLGLHAARRRFLCFGILQPWICLSTLCFLDLSFLAKFIMLLIIVIFPSIHSSNKYKSYLRAAFSLHQLMTGDAPRWNYGRSIGYIHIPFIFEKCCERFLSRIDHQKFTSTLM